MKICDFCHRHPMITEAKEFKLSWGTAKHMQSKHKDVCDGCQRKITIGIRQLLKDLEAVELLKE